jgi:hypothetical protein
MVTDHPTPTPTSALAFPVGSFELAERLKLALIDNGFHAEIAATGWGTEELVVTIRVDDRILKLLRLADLLPPLAPLLDGYEPKVEL